MMNFTISDWQEKFLSVSTNLVSNDNFLIAGVSGVVIILIAFMLLPYIRSWFPVTVNCWFCNTNCTVPVESQNSWYCKNCDQYNGFSDDGGYNRNIPEQYYEGLNPQFAERNAQSKVDASNGLCKSCNINQELKRTQLASFEPLDQNNYDWEVEAFSELLEKNYKLCSYCERVVSNTLEHQIKNLNLTQLLTTAGHKLANSSVRFLNHHSNPVDLTVLLNSTKYSLRVCFLLLVLLLFETYDKASLQTALNGRLEEYFAHTDWQFQYLNSVQTASTYYFDHLSAFNFVPVTFCSLLETIRRYDNRIFVDCIAQLGWAVFLCLELSSIFIKTQLDIKSIQILVLTLIFTVTLWKFVYFKYFFSKSNRNSPNLKQSPPINNISSPKTAKTEHVASTQKTWKATPVLPQKDSAKPKTVDRSFESDLGIGSLNLGPRQSVFPSNPYTRNVFSVSNDSFPSKRKPLILPSRLNFNLKNELSEINIPFSRPSSQSSGYETLNKSGDESQNSSLNGDEDYDIPIKSSSPLQVSNCGMMPPFLPTAGASPYELYSYYHFTAKFQASYGTQPHNLSTCSSCVGSTAQMNSNKWFLVIFLMFVMIVLQESVILYSLFNQRS